MVVWGCGRAFLATPSPPEMRTLSLGGEVDWSKGVGSGSLGATSMFTLALIVVSLSGALQNKECEEQLRALGQMTKGLTFPELTVMLKPMSSIAHSQVILQ